MNQAKKDLYKVTFSHTEYAQMEVEATSEQEADDIAYKMLEEEGVPYDANITDRDYSIDYVEVKQ